jgi:hypothetical protein
MHHCPAALAPGGEQGGDRRDGRVQQGDIVAERGAEAARLDEIALHVDDHEGGRFGGEAVVERRCGDAEQGGHGGSLSLRPHARHVPSAGDASSAHGRVVVRTTPGIRQLR